MEKEIKLTGLEKDALKETANISAGNASTTLSDITKKKVNIVISDLNFVLLSDLKVFGGPQRLVVGVYTPVSGEMGGTIIIMFPIESALALSSILQKKEVSSTALSQGDQEALRKMGNILSDSYLDALSEFLDISLQRMESKIVSTFGESIMDLILLSIDEDCSHGLLIKTNFSVEKSTIQGDFILLLATKKMDNVLKKIKEKLG